MRSPREHLVGIATSPLGREFFNLRAEDELRMWLYVELCILGVNVSRYLEFLISLLRYPISALSTVQGIVGVDTYTGQHLFASSLEELETLGNWMRAERRAIALGCLIGASCFDANLSRIMMLVDEVMTRLDKVDGRDANLMEEEFKVPNEEFHAPATNIEASMLADSAYETQEEFTVSLQPVLIEEISRWTEKNIGTTYCNNTNNRINSYNKNNEAYNRNNNVSIVNSIDSQQLDSKNSFGFVESMERQREKDRLQLEIERLQLARLQAKFNEDVEAIWNAGLQNIQEEQQDCKLLQDRIIPPAPAIFPNSQPVFTIPDGSPLSVYSSSSKNGKTIDIDSLYPGSRLDAPDNDVQNSELINVQDQAENSFKYNAGYNTTKNARNWPDLISNDLWRRKGTEDNWVYLTRNIQAVGSLPVASCKLPHGSHIESPSILKLSNLPEPDEDLLTSARTHFRPIKDDGYWADGTTFPVNTAVEQVAYRRSESGNVWYLPGGESPYMEYRENDTASPIVSMLSSNLTPKFRVRQCDKSVQTDPVRFAVRRKLIFDDDCYDSTPFRGEDSVINKDEEEEEEAVIEGEETITAQYQVKNKQFTDKQNTIAINNEEESKTSNTQEIERNDEYTAYNGNRKELEGENRKIGETEDLDENGDGCDCEEDEDEVEGEQGQEENNDTNYTTVTIDQDNEKGNKQNENEQEKLYEQGEGKDFEEDWH
ncbi:hypothetical protein EAI_16436 [Harpegnathos saltator]|uniref:Uncharacterized protein n=1 Tax=Harpegnathos saltator TaxID=610380 RepID=E2C5I0_HARSA|nr:hypothetical protein EAI_16436 [Harpegnathos saltator]